MAIEGGHDLRSPCLHYRNGRLSLCHPSTRIDWPAGSRLGLFGFVPSGQIFYDQHGPVKFAWREFFFIELAQMGGTKYLIFGPIVDIVLV